MEKMKEALIATTLFIKLIVNIMTIMQFLNLNNSCKHCLIIIIIIKNVGVT